MIIDQLQNAEQHYGLGTGIEGVALFAADRL